MKEKYLEQRLYLSEDLRHYISIDNIEEVKIIQEEIKNIDLIINNLIN